MIFSNRASVALLHLLIHVRMQNNAFVPHLRYSGCSANAKCLQKNVTKGNHQTRYFRKLHSPSLSLIFLTSRKLIATPYLFGVLPLVRHPGPARMAFELLMETLHKGRAFFNVQQIHCRSKLFSSSSKSPRNSI